MKTSDDRLETKHVRNLRKEIIKLKRENAQLRKKNMRLEGELSYSVIDDCADDDFHAANPSMPKEKLSCPSCGNYDVNTFVAGIHEFYNCCSCKSKGRINVLEKQCC